MHYICVCWKGLAAPPIQPIIHQRHGTVTTFASKSGRISLNSLSKSCKTCLGKGAVECRGCKQIGRERERIRRTETYLNGGNVLIVKDLG
ncbi:uncharacterized protein LOC109816920 isoform X2 [Cajanus cajan]|uniref:uncharacterized protein LOC109816920 isoform X2 n=1 Tax=Cajanus cajan TaxID=3821 RepID=UPI0010FB77C8|nr:uncharacterized protein LOC109816920 isoform X2 [Cajanus cajan]